MVRVRPILLVHGAWHGAWCWATLQAELDRRGLPSYAVDLPGHGLSTLPLGDLHGDAEHVATVLAGIGDEVVLVGHSYGGAVVTHASGSAHAIADHVAHLVYLTAFALDDGESVWGFTRSRPRRAVALDAAVLGGDDGTSRLDPDAAPAALYAMCPPAAVGAAVARLGPQPVASFQQPVTGSPRATIPSTYVKCTADQAIHIELQDELAARCDHVVTFESDHSPFMAMPVAVADVLEPLARL
ncbi:MAG TPA: alpha/beta fold hydrolase [Ilumatobacteraceae bacterium]|nr:alpha/beta fold hydrolase [Ilumatobacteraceae bacterium]